jgi:cytoskeletal protein RodZ
MMRLLAELKQAREARGMSLADISDTTLINVKYLAALEDGRIGILPEAYVRAFIREYAAAVGLDPDATMKRFDEERQPTGGPSHPHPTPQATGRETTHKTTEPLSEGRFQLSPRTVTVGAAVVVVVAAVAFLWNSIANQQSPPVQEIPFQSVVKEHEAMIAHPEQPPVHPSVIRTDSLTLSIATTDSVWIMISIDSLPSREYLFRPGARAAWHGQDRFLLTIGNAGAVQFTLNHKRFGTIGAPGRVLRNVVFSRQDLAAKR